MNVIQFPQKSAEPEPEETLSPELAVRALKGLVAGMIDQGDEFELLQKRDGEQVVIYFQVGMAMEPEMAEKFNDGLKQLFDYINR
ncbi:hypothetical protein MRBLMC3_000125 [Sphingobium sp. LMC3-1-1.1]|uniref:hypothetical protein n=1 Tax=Sphingobium sp. LMC3-1-1.1 TaxID=3135241 RepID=UPI00342B2833